MTNNSCSTIRHTFLHATGQFFRNFFRQAWSNLSQPTMRHVALRFALCALLLALVAQPARADSSLVLKALGKPGGDAVCSSCSFFHSIHFESFHVRAHAHSPLNACLIPFFARMSLVFYAQLLLQVLVFIHGASLPGAQYTTLFTQLQQASPLNLWVVLPGFTLDTPNPLEIKVWCCDRCARSVHPCCV
jgi:hypothetical protein